VIYIDPSQSCQANRNWKYNTVSHLVGDTDEELIKFAVSIGLRAEWFQKKQSINHFDLTPNMRRMAIANGAKQISVFELVNMIQERRKGKGK
jgi:hypothetical protein